MSRYAALIICGIILSGSALGAQGNFLERREPALQVSVSSGVWISQTIVDGRSGTTWDFSTAQQYRAAVEKAVSASSSVGMTLGYASLPMQYGATGVGMLPFTSCPFRCRAKADYWTAAATFRTVDGMRLQQLLEITAGVSQFGNFRERESGEKLAPRKGDIDPTLIVSYGVGWAAERRFQVYLMGDIGLNVHTRTGLTANTLGTPKLMVFRLLIRSGIIQ